MKVLLINRNNFVDGGADRVFLNTIDLLESNRESRNSAPSPVSAAKHTHTHTDTQTQFGGEVDLQVERFTRRDVGMEAQVDARKSSWWSRILLVKDYLYNKKVAKGLNQKIKDFSPDVVHLHLFYGTLSASVLKVLNNNKIPIVLTVHDYRLLCPANAMLDRKGRICEKCFRTKYYQCLFKCCSEGNLFFSGVIMLEAYMRKYLYRPLKLVDHFIFVSQFARNKHLEFEPRYALKSSHLYNMNVTVPETPIIKGDYFLYYGRLSREKGILTLITAAKEANVKLVIAGNGPQEPELLTCLQKIVNRQPSTDKILLAGFKSGTDLQNLIVNSSFVVVPSEWYENNPMSIVEAFTMGKPVIGSRIGGIPELVTPDTGLLFEPFSVESLSEALVRAEGMSTEEYNRLAAGCRKFAEENFSPRAHVDQLLKIYREAINA